MTERMDPTARGDMVASKVRHWYEANRESWFDRHFPFGVSRKHGSVLADDFMLELINEVYRADPETPL